MRGWFHEACVKKNLPRSTKAYYMQCTTWKDKKQVMLLATNRVGFSQGLTVQWHVKKKIKHETIQQPQAHADYVRSMNGVDRNYQDSHNSSTSIRTNRWYLRIFCCALDWAVHAQHSIVTFLAVQGIGKPEWKKYRDKMRVTTISKLILGYLFSICEQVLSSLVTARNASFA